MTDDSVFSSCGILSFMTLAVESAADCEQRA